MPTVHPAHAPAPVAPTSTSVPAPSLVLRGLTLAWGRRTYVMAIVNATPDSFSGDGTGGDVGRAVDAASAAVAAGADILDVGGESTRPGAAAVSADEEIARTAPAVAAIRARFDVPISIDTSKAAVAAAALDAGADMVNDVWGLRADPDLAGLVAARGVPVVVMHNRLTPANVEVAARVGAHYAGVAYADLVGDVCRELRASIDIARGAGVPAANVIVDPGIGFGKTPAQNLALLDRVGEVRSLGFPLLVGPSRKSFIGAVLDLPAAQRLEGTAAAVAVAIARGADIVRVHDVAAMVRVARMTDAIVRR